MKHMYICSVDRKKVCDLFDETQFSARNDVVKTYLNQISELTFEVPIKNPKCEWIKNENLVLYKNEYYIIKTPVFSIDTDGTELWEVSCKHYSDILASNMISLEETTPINVVSLMKRALCYDDKDQPTLGWKVGNVTVDRVALRGLEKVESSSFSILLSIAEKYEGALSFDSQKMTVDLIPAVQESKPVLNLRFHRNLKGIEVTYDSSELVTRLYCYGAEDDNGNEIDIMSVNPTKMAYIENYDYFIGRGYTQEFINANKNFFGRTNIWRDDNYVSPQDLYNQGIKELKKIAFPTAQIKVEALALEVVGDQNITNLKVGDCIRAVDLDYGFDFLCNVTSREISGSEEHILKIEVTNSIQYKDTLSGLFKDVNNMSGVVSSGGTVRGSKIDSITVSQVKDLSLYYLSVDEANIKYLTAEQIKAKYITTDELHAKYITADEIGAKYATIIELHSNYITTVQFETVTAKISEANINIAKINTLLSGTVTSGSTMTITLNAKNATIDSAFFKQLVADNVAAVDIFGERISTNEFKVGSDDGRLSIVDNTIQIKDANRPRVQIGKDASGDYNIYVWDKVGKLMFDATGVTADGIQKPIIRDDMVATNANISGDKLNIASVITKINANSTLIESSHIKYDGKTLDVAFNNLQTTVDGIQIGGRNLCLNTKPYSNSSNWAYAWGTINILDEPTAISKKCMCYTVTTPIVNTAPFYNAIPSGVVIVGKEYTWSVYVKTSKNMQLRIGQENGGYKTFNVTTEWHEFKYTYVASVSSGKAFVFYPLKVADLSVGDKIYVHSLMLVEGNKIGTWQEAPEDTDGQIATLTESIKSQSTQISVAQGQIGTLITDVSQSKSDIATVKGGLTTATGNISTLQSNYSTLNQTVSGLSSTVGSHTSSITTLTETANTALSKIDGLEIGGTNIATNTNQGIINWSWGMQVGDYTRTTVEEDGILCCKLTKGDIPRSGWNYISYSGINRKKYLPNKQYTISFDIKASVACFVNVQLKNGDSTYPLCPGYTMGKTIPNTWVTLSAIITTIDSFPTSMNQILYITGFDTTIGVTYIFRNLIISEGNKRPPWSPAPEDVDNRITTEIKTVTDKQASFDVLLTGITGRVSATESTVTTVTNTVNNNKANWDKAPTALANANSAQTTANTANTQANTNKTNIATLTTTVTETKSTVATLKLDYEGFKTNVASTYTTKTEFNNLQIGGRNLALGTSVEKLNLRNCDYEISSLGIDKTNQYTVSFYFKANKAGTYLVYLNDDTGASRTSITFGSIIANDTAYHFYSFTAKPTGTTAVVNLIRIRVYGNSATDLLGSVRLLKLEEGSRNTTYSEAPEDIENSITSISDKQTTFEATLNGITGRVSSVETVTKVVTDNKINWDKAPTALSTANTANTLANANKTNLANLTTTVTETKTAVSNLQLDYNGFKTTVSETYTTKTEFGNLEIGGVNLLVKKTVTKGKYLNAAGAEVVDGQWFYSDYIPVTGIQNIVTSGYTNLGISPSTCYYDSNKKFIKGINNNGQSLSKLISISSGIAYIRFSGTIADLNNELKLEKGTKSTGYSPSPDDIDASIATVDGKFVNYSTTTQMNSAIDQTKNAITQTVSNNYKELKGDNTLSHALSMIATGKLVYQDPTFMINANMVNPYNLTGTFVRIAKPSDCPTSSTHCLEIKATGASTVANTGVGGFYQKTDSRANAIFVIKYLIKLPVGYKLMTATNSMGTGYTDKFLTPTEGTGKWEEYVRMVECGATGTFSTGGHIWVSGSPTPTESAPLVWYLGAIYQYDVTDSPDMYSRLNTAESKLTATSLVTTISTAINGGTALTTTKFTMDATGLHIKGGGFDISNNAGIKVLSADVSGNLVLNNITANNGTFNGTINATSGSIGDFVIMSGAITSGYTTSGGRLENYLTLNKTMFEVVLTGVGNARCAYNYIGVTANSTNAVNTTWMDGNEIYTNGIITSRRLSLNALSTAGDDNLISFNQAGTIIAGITTMPNKTGIRLHTYNNGAWATWIDFKFNGTNFNHNVYVGGTLQTSGSATFAECVHIPYRGERIDYYNRDNGAQRKGWAGFYNGGDKIHLYNDVGNGVVLQGNQGWIEFYGTNSDDCLNVRASHSTVWFNEKISVLTLTQRSREKYKSNIVTNDDMDALSIVNQAKVYRYNLKAELEKGKTHDHYGFVIERETPKEVISCDGNGIDTYSMATINWQATQELSKTLDTHDDRLTELEKENTFLKGKLACLQAQLDSYTNPIA